MALSKRRVLLEVAVASVEDALAAQQGGADRLELNSALALGGLTPSLGTLVEVKAAVSLPVVVLIRPRPGGFAYSEADVRVMQRDMELALQHGADGIAVGVLTTEGRVDRERCRSLVQQAPGRTVVFHRAFDVTPDPFAALEELIDLGFRRVLTSGQEETAYNGAELIAQLRAQAAGRIEVLPAGGINRFTLADVLARTGCDQVHASLRARREDRSVAARPQVSFGGPVRIAEDRYDATSAEAVAELAGRLARAPGGGT
jgi:copper homeostasis protein